MKEAFTRFITKSIKKNVMMFAKKFSIGLFLFICLSLNVVSIDADTVCDDNVFVCDSTAIANGEWVSQKVWDVNENPYKLFAQDWMLLTAGNRESLNTMTISWGELGVLWGKPVVTVFVSPNRYTHGFVESNDYFTVTAFPEDYREALQYLGSHSGRDGDKIAASGLTLRFTERGNPAFEQARLIIECRKIYYDALDATHFNEETKKMYQRMGVVPHTIFIGEIVGVWVKEKLQD